MKRQLRYYIDTLFEDQPEADCGKLFTGLIINASREKDLILGKLLLTFSPCIDFTEHCDFGLYGTKGLHAFGFSFRTQNGIFAPRDRKLVYDSPNVFLDRKLQRRNSEESFIRYVQSLRS